MINIPKNTFRLIILLKDSWEYSGVEKKFTQSVQKYISKIIIRKELNISRQTLFNILKRDRDYFDSNTDEDYNVVFGLSETGFKIYQEYLHSEIMPKDDKKLAMEFKKMMKSFLTNEYKKILHSDIYADFEKLKQENRVLKSHMNKQDKEMKQFLIILKELQDERKKKAKA